MSIIPLPVKLDRPHKVFLALNAPKCHRSFRRRSQKFDRISNISSRQKARGVGWRGEKTQKFSGKNNGTFERGRTAESRCGAKVPHSKDPPPPLVRLDMLTLSKGGHFIFDLRSGPVDTCRSHIPQRTLNGTSDAAIPREHFSSICRSRI